MSLLSDKVAELHRSGTKAAHEILRALVEPTVIVTPGTRKRPKSAAQKAFILAVVDAKLATRAELRAAEDPAALVRERLRDKVTTGTANERTIATRDAMPVVIALLALLAEGASAAGDDADDDEDATTRTPGPSWWDANFPEQDAPSLHAIRTILGELSK